MPGLENGTQMSRGSSGGYELFKARTDGTALVGTRRSKRQRASSGEAYQVERQIPPPEHPAATVQPILKPPEAPACGLIEGESRNAFRHPLREEDVCSKDSCGGWSRDDSGLNKAVTARNQTPGTTEDGGNRKRINVSIVPLGSLEEGPSIGSGSTNTGGASGEPATVKSSRILPVRSAPVSWRPLAATSSSGVLSRNGSKRVSQVHEKYVQHRKTHKQKMVDATASVATGGVAEGVAATVAGGWGSAVTQSNANGTVDDARAGHDGEERKPHSLLAESRLGYPSIADTCGGIVLRLTPGERSLEPWGTTLAPLRAMCDIEPSLSRAGIEYRGVIHAVEGAQELKSHHQIKVNDGDVGTAALLGMSSHLQLFNIFAQITVGRQPCCYPRVTREVMRSVLNRNVALFHPSYRDFDGWRVSLHLHTWSENTNDYVEP